MEEIGHLIADRGCPISTNCPSDSDAEMLRAREVPTKMISLSTQLKLLIHSQYSRGSTVQGDRQGKPVVVDTSWCIVPLMGVPFCWRQRE
eukprot:225738-Prymnesium_polylepis.2